MHFIIYWLPTFLWLGFAFPSNGVLTHDNTLRIIAPVLTRLLPYTEYINLELAYAAIRKSAHFFGYGLLAFLLFRAFRGGSREWRPKWLLYAGVISLAYGALDESLQAFLPLRNGQFSDWMINAAGVFCTLGVIIIKNSHRVKSRTVIKTMNSQQ